jgi:AAA+ superfamily predicted ATPase
MSELQDLVALLRAETPLLVIETPDEARVVELFRQSMAYAWRAQYRWSVTEGLRRFDLDHEEDSGIAPDFGATLAAIRDAGQRATYLLLDAQPYLGYANYQRMLRDIIQRNGTKTHVLALIGTKVELPESLAPFAVHFAPRLPDVAALLRIVQEDARRYAAENGGRQVTFDREAVKQIVRNLRGLSETDARRIARQLIFGDGVLDANDLPELARLKFELLNRSGHLHYEFDTARFADVGGARRLKQWVQQRRDAFLQDPPPAGLEPPKGVLLLGVQGCGKSLLAKAVAGGFGIPLVRLDFGTLYDKYLGETEKNLRAALDSTEQLAPCVLWIDEIEKGLAAGNGDGDNGLSRRVLGYLLTWMAERKSRVFVVATANQVQELPAELLRKGRFDEIFFVDLPDGATRAEIFALHLDRRRLPREGIDLSALATASEGFSGAEIEQTIVSALYATHASSAELDTEALLQALRDTRPLSVLMAEQVQALRAWALPRTVPAD